MPISSFIFAAAALLLSMLFAFAAMRYCWRFDAISRYYCIADADAYAKAADAAFIRHAFAAYVAASPGAFFALRYFLPALTLLRRH